MNNLKEINRKFLIGPKLLFFFINLQFYTLHVFRGVFAKEKFHIDNKDLGTYLGLLFFITFFSNIFIAAMNDKFGRHKLFLLTLLCTSCFFFQMFYLESYVGDSALVFWINMLLYLGCNTAIPPLLDKITLDYLSRIPNVGTKTYGTQRMWGTLGYSVCGYIVEMMVRGKEGKMNFNGLSQYNMVTTGLACLVVLLTVSGSVRGGSRVRHNIFNGLKELIKNMDYMFFIFIILLNGITRAAMTFFLTLYWKDVLNLKGYSFSSLPGWLEILVNVFNKNPVSTANLFGIILEVLILYKASFITTKFGLFWPLLFAQIAQFLRFFCYYFLSYNFHHKFLAVCFFEFFKGINFGLTHASGVQLATRMCPPHLKATSQMIYSGTFTALGSVCAGILFRFIFDSDKIKDENIPISEKAVFYSNFFMLNMLISVFTILLFFYKYSFRENILFSHRNEEKKLEKYDFKEEVVK